MTPGFATKYGFTSQTTNIDTQKIDGVPLEIYNIVSARFSL